MSDALITAIVTAVLTLLGVVIQSRAQYHATMAEMQRQSELSDQKLDAKLERHMAVTDEKIDELTREVRKHNDFVTRVPILEEKAKATDRRLTDLEHRPT